MCAVDQIPYMREILFGVIVVLGIWTVFGSSKCPCKKELEELKNEIKELKNR